MASDTPIKHSDIIQEGNPFDETIKGFDQLIKLVKELQKAMKGEAREVLKLIKDLTTATKAGKKALTDAAKGTEKLSAEQKELLRIEKALEKEKAKLSVANSKQARDLFEVKEKTRQANAEMRKSVRAQKDGVKSTNTWSKALGSFAFKFNALGNIAANALSRITQGLKRAINRFISLEKIVKSTQTSSDRFDRSMGRLEGSFSALNRAIALGDFSNLGKMMRDAADAAEDYVRAMDTLNDTQNAIAIQTSKLEL